jgi:hypothetical protein
MIVPATTLAIPLAVEIIYLGFQEYKNPGCIKANFLKMKQNAINSITKQPNETNTTFRKRIALLALKILFIAGGTAAAYMLAPPALAIAAAILSFQLLDAAWKGIRKAPQWIKNTKHFVKDAFHQRPNESLDNFHQRRAKAMRTIAACSFAFAASTAAICTLGYVGVCLSTATGAWGLSQSLPFQTPVVVFLEYAALGAGHAALGVHSWKKGDRASALFHMTSAITAIAFPVCYIIQGTEVRLHHSFIGLALQLLPWRPIQCLGSIITFDSFLNCHAEANGLVRGEVISRNYVNQYDYMNAFINYISFAMVSISSLTLFSRISNSLTKKKQTA